MSLSPTVELLCPKCNETTVHTLTGGVAFMDGFRNGKRTGWREYEVRCTCGHTHYYEPKPKGDYRDALNRKKTFGDW